MRLLKVLFLVLFLVSISLLLFQDQVAVAQDPPSRIGGRPALEERVNQFVIAQALGPLTDSVSGVFSNERKEKSLC
jgi:hypothetical protein